MGFVKEWFKDLIRSTWFWASVSFIILLICTFVMEDEDKLYTCIGHFVVLLAFAYGEITHPSGDGRKSFYLACAIGFCAFMYGVLIGYAEALSSAPAKIFLGIGGGISAVLTFVIFRYWQKNSRYHKYVSLGIAIVFAFSLTAAAGRLIWVSNFLLDPSEPEVHRMHVERTSTETTTTRRRHGGINKTTTYYAYIDGTELGGPKLMKLQVSKKQYDKLHGPKKKKLTVGVHPGRFGFAWCKAIS